MFLGHKTKTAFYKMITKHNKNSAFHAVKGLKTRTSDKQLGKYGFELECIMRCSTKDLCKKTSTRDNLLGGA